MLASVFGFNVALGLPATVTRRCSASDIGTDIDVVGEVGDGHEAVQAAVSLSPDVVVLDMHMPGLDGVSAAREIRREAPGVGILMLTMLDTLSAVYAKLGVTNRTEAALRARDAGRGR